MWYEDAFESVSGSLYSDGRGPPDGKVLPVLTPKGTSTIITGKTSTMSSQSSKSRIKPAAITMRKKSGYRSQGSVSTLGSLNVTLNPVYERQGLDGDSETEVDDLPLRMEDGPDLVATNALTCLDETASVAGMAANYPEFDVYSGVPNSPTWSVDGLTVDGLTIDDEEEAQQQLDEENRRQRWREEANGLIERSVPGYSGYYEDDDSSSQSSDNGFA